MKKTVTFLLMCTVLCVTVFAQNESDFQTDGRGTITGYTGSAKSVVIPSRIRGVPVTAIGGSAFEDKGLTSVTIPYGVTSIGEYAFKDNKFTSITIPASVTFIDGRAFFQFGLAGDPAITSITIGANVEIRGELESSQMFEYNYRRTYNRQAGTYTLRGDDWVLSSTTPPPQPPGPGPTPPPPPPPQPPQPTVTTVNCSSCQGRGWTVEYFSSAQLREANYGWCAQCGRTDMGHSHPRCSRCNGTGKVRL